MSIDTDPRDLWRAVMIQAARDAAGTGALRPSPGERGQVRAWARSPDFALVCLWAGVDPASARLTLERLVDCSPAERERMRRLLAFAGGAAPVTTTLSPKDPVT